MSKQVTPQERLIEWIKNKAPESFYREIDGFLVYQQIGDGFLESWHLRAIADYLDAQNKEWGEHIEKNLNGTSEIPPRASGACMSSSRNSGASLKLSPSPSVADSTAWAQTAARNKTGCLTLNKNRSTFSPS